MTQRRNINAKMFLAIKPPCYTLRVIFDYKSSSPGSVSYIRCSCSCSFGGNNGSRGWYDNPQPALSPVFMAAQYATPCVWSVCMHGWCAAATVRVFCLWELCAVHLILRRSGCKFV